MKHRIIWAVITSIVIVVGFATHAFADPGDYVCFMPEWVVVCAWQ